MQNDATKKKCPTCGAVNNQEVFCKQCGAFLGAPIPAPSPSSPAQTVPLVVPPATPEPSPSLSVQTEPLGAKTVQLEETSPISPPIVPIRPPRKFDWRWLIPVALVLLLIFGTLLVRNIVTHQSENSVATPTPHPSATMTAPNDLGEITAPNGNIIGVNDGSRAPFDVWHSQQEVAYKRQAAQALQSGDGARAVSLWQDALKIENNDAEALIYIENQRIQASGKPFLTLVVGVTFVSSNDLSPQRQLQGVYVAQHEYNNGSAPFKLRILIANSGSEVSYTGLVARQIVQIASHDSTIVGVVGWLDSANSDQALPVLAKAKIPQVSPQASDDNLSGISPYFFRVVPPDKVQAQAGAQFAEQTLKLKNPVVFLDPEDNYSQNLAHDFEQQFARDGHPALHEETFITNKTKDFTSLIKDAEKYHPDAFYFTSKSKGDTGLFQDALPTNGPFATLPVISADAGYVAHPKSYNRWFFTGFAYPDEWGIVVGKDYPPFFHDYSADFNADGQKPGGYYGYTRADDNAILSYDATQVILAGIQKALEANGQKLLTPQDLASALPQITGSQAVQGVSGQITFGPDHNPVNKAVVLLYVDGGGHIQMKSVQGCFMKGCP